MDIDHKKIIAALGGPVAVSERLRIRVPSVYGWMAADGGIPDARLIELGADIEATGLYSRKEIRPNDWQKIWPELISTDLKAVVMGCDTTPQGLVCTEFAADRLAIDVEGIDRNLTEV
jgi:hypothetical protein